MAKDLLRGILEAKKPKQNMPNKLSSAGSYLSNVAASFEKKPKSPPTKAGAKK